MSREKQIEEIARIIHETPFSDMHRAVALYNAGYRKQSEGKWISNDLGGYEWAYYCSECGWIDGYPFNDRHKYCPHCGAKMDGKE